MINMKNFFLTALPAFLSVLIVVICATLFSACYTLKQGAAMLRLLHSAVPLETLAGEDGAADDKRFVKQIEDIKRFATEELGLRETKNYSSYVALRRDYLAEIVSASAKDSFTGYQWWFPVVGKVPYKGFFDAADAKAEAQKLAKKDLDVWIRPVDAFSTLGWFRDPLYSFMKDYSEYRTANLIIHESFHATVFIKNNVQFNEELAEFIGNEGARLYIKKKYGEGSREIQEVEDREADSARFVAFIQSIIAELKPVYESDLPRREKLSKREEIITEAQKRFLENYDALFANENYKTFAEMEINNAYLELYNLYYERGGKLKELFAESGAGIKQFIALTKKINTKSDPMSQLEKLVTGSAD
jgi:predicted aminopeptidase